jgi:ribosomal protein L13E
MLGIVSTYNSDSFRWFLRHKGRALAARHTILEARSIAARRNAYVAMSLIRTSRTGRGFSSNKLRRIGIAYAKQAETFSGCVQISKRKIDPINSQMADSTERLLTTTRGDSVGFVLTVNPQVRDARGASGAARLGYLIRLTGMKAHDHVQSRSLIRALGTGAVAGHILCLRHRDSKP